MRNIFEPVMGNSPTRRIARFGKMLFDRHLTDSSGGNISIREGETIFITPRYAGSKFFWDLGKRQICRIDAATGALRSANGYQPSREMAVHLALYALTGHTRCCVIHAHPRHLVAAAMLEVPIVPVLENVLKFGEIPVIPFARACSMDLANAVAQAMEPAVSLLDQHPLMVLAPYHGVFAMGLTIESTFDCIERLEQNAFCLLNIARAGKDVVSIHRELSAAAKI